MLRSSFPILCVDDVAASLGFYRELLGFEERYQFPPPGDPGCVSLRLADGRLGLSDADFQAPHGRA
jgi:catechol 2,3-dioxygenase-like lactoylglutathione lyase family enzyme